MIVPHVVQSRNYNNEAMYIYINIYKSMYYIWSCIFHIYTSKCVCVRHGANSETGMQRIYLAAEKYATILSLAACLATDSHTHTAKVTAWCRHLVGLCRWQCIDKTMAVHYAAHLAWRSSKKLLKNRLIKLQTVSIALKLKLFEVYIKCTLKSCSNSFIVGSLLTGT